MGKTKQLSVEAGDWVRFMKDQVLVIAVAQAVLEKRNWPHEFVVVTDVGYVPEESVIQVARGEHIETAEHL